MKNRQMGFDGSSPSCGELSYYSGHQKNHIYHPRFQQVRGNEKSKSNFKEGNQGLSLQTVLVHSYL